MFSPDVYFIDINIIYQIFAKNIWYISKILIIAYTLFYWLPTKIFPQEYTGQGIQKIVYNFIYMIAYVEVVVTFLIAIKIFTLLLFIFILIGTKLAFLKWYYKKNVTLLLSRLRVSMMLWILDFFDNPKNIRDRSINFLKDKIANFQKSITPYSILKYLLFFIVFFYIISTLIARGLYSYSDPTSDTSQFIEWVDFLQQNQLFWTGKAFGADFYGQAISIFFINIFTNIDLSVIFSLYPILLLIILYCSIFFIVKDITKSTYVAIIAVMIHGIILMGPFSNFFIGKVLSTSFPKLVDWYGFRVYIPNQLDLFRHGHYVSYTSYIRYISALAYEHSSVFVLLNSYFLIKTLQTHLDRYLILYILTLMLVFTFHGGGAIVLIVISIFIALNAMIFRKIDKSMLKKGLIGVFVAAIIGNLWMLSMIKYGIPKNIGAAAPFLDKLLGTKRSVQDVVTSGIKIVAISDITTLHIVMMVMIVFAYIFALFTKKRFVYSSFILISSSIFLVYFAPNIGLPLLAKQSRLSEYMFFAITFLFSFYYFFFLYKPVFYIFKKYAKYIIFLLCYIIFISLVFTVPRWMDTYFFWKNINEIEYTSIPQIILKINRENRPFNWTVISYVQEYAKVKNKGYHINTQNFLLRYNPKDKYLKVPTPNIYLFVENFPNPYKGMQEWYYRWRSDIQNDLKSWVAIYSATHDNIKIYLKTKTVTVYKIDNNSYIEYLREKPTKK